jgi:hypothetical protein
LCRHCGGQMKIISFIYERKVIKKIVDHLGLLKEVTPQRSSAPPAPLSKYSKTNSEPYNDGWSEYEELFVDVNTV